MTHSDRLCRGRIEPLRHPLQLARSNEDGPPASNRDMVMHQTCDPLRTISYRQVLFSGETRSLSTFVCTGTTAEVEIRLTPER